MHQAACDLPETRGCEHKLHVQLCMRTMIGSFPEFLFGVKKADCATSSRSTASITAVNKRNQMRSCHTYNGVGVCCGDVCMLCSRGAAVTNVLTAPGIP